jgi:hypothetical protein
MNQGERLGAGHSALAVARRTLWSPLVGRAPALCRGSANP